MATPIPLFRHLFVRIPFLTFLKSPGTASGLFSLKLFIIAFSLFSNGIAVNNGTNGKLKIPITGIPTATAGAITPPGEI